MTGVIAINLLAICMLYEFQFKETMHDFVLRGVYTPRIVNDGEAPQSKELQ
jgi:hypothetical protein